MNEHLHADMEKTLFVWLVVQGRRDSTQTFKYGQKKSSGTSSDETRDDFEHSLHRCDVTEQPISHEKTLNLIEKLENHRKIPRACGEATASVCSSAEKQEQRERDGE